MQKPKNPSGVRDFTPKVLRRRQWIMDQITRQFELFGFEEIQTGAMENLSTLTGKYGEEGDQLLYKLLNTKDLATRIDQNKTTEENLHKLTKMGLRYDLTVPLARFTVQHQHELYFPFRRYQIQPVWRADRAQKGRYREFWQCDADIIGSKSLINEADLIHIYTGAFKAIGLPQFQLKINHRKILEAAAESINQSEQFTSFCIAIDKLDKGGWDLVSKELEPLGVTVEQIEFLKGILVLKPFSSATLDVLKNTFASSSLGLEGIQELEFILGLTGEQDGCTIDLTLARGLDYYTGCIFEAIIPESGIGSVSGGGRYDNLTAVFGLKDISGVGISFGIDRLYDILLDRNLFPDSMKQNNHVLLCHFDVESQAYCIKWANELRTNGISCEVYPDKKKINKQLDFANKKGITQVLIAGSNEMEQNQFTFKDLESGNQTNIATNTLVEHLNNLHG